MLIMTQNNYNFEGAIFRNSISGFRVRKKKREKTILTRKTSELYDT